MKIKWKKGLALLLTLMLMSASACNRTGEAGESLRLQTEAETQTEEESTVSTEEETEETAQTEETETSEDAETQTETEEESSEQSTSASEEESETTEIQSGEEETTAEETSAEAPASDVSFTDTSDTVYTTGNVNLRTAPSISDSEVITVLASATELHRTGISEEWSRVDYNGTAAYVSNLYLSEEMPETTAPTNTGSNTGNGHIVAIDAGHQAHGNSEQEPIGPGASTTKAKVATGTQGVATGVAESVVNLTVSLQLKQELINRGYTVVMIRESQDVNISNSERAAIANASGAEIFLRIHCNGSSNQGIAGIVTMCPSSANPYIPHLYQASYSLSLNLVNQMCASTEANNQGVLATDEMSGINWCTIPVSIIEMGYMSNPTEDVLLNDASYQAKLVQGMANGVDAYFGN